MKKFIYRNLFTILSLVSIMGICAISTNAYAVPKKDSVDTGYYKDEDYAYAELTGNEDSVTGRLTAVTRAKKVKGDYDVVWQPIQRPNNYTAKMTVQWLKHSVLDTTLHTLTI